MLYDSEDSVAQSSSNTRKLTSSTFATALGLLKNDLLLGRRAFTNLVDSIKLRIRPHGITVKRWRKQSEERVMGTNVEKVKAVRIETQGLLEGTWSVARSGR